MGHNPPASAREPVHPSLVRPQMEAGAAPGLQALPRCPVGGDLPGAEPRLRHSSVRYRTDQDSVGWRNGMWFCATAKAQPGRPMTSTPNRVCPNGPPEPSPRRKCARDWSAVGLRPATTARLDSLRSRIGLHRCPKSFFRLLAAQGPGPHGHRGLLTGVLVDRRRYKLPRARPTPAKTWRGNGVAGAGATGQSGPQWDHPGGPARVA
jgi:hypothetical protein